ncbi:MAG: hypothetical protein Kow0069_25680 [Promethearchaeota archaeon]
MVSPEEAPDGEKRTWQLGVAVLVAFAVPWLWLAGLHWREAGFDDSAAQYLLMLAVIEGSLFTTTHLWARMHAFPADSNLRRLFRLMGVTFVVIATIFCYMLVDSLLRWSNTPGISDRLNSAVPQLEWDIFGVPAWHTSIPMDSLVIFALMTISVSFYTWPMERYVRQQVPWHAISMLFLTAVLPLMPLMRESELALSIGTVAGSLWIVYNFLYLFFLYFRVALKSPGRMRTAGLLVAFGLVSFVFVWISGWALGFLFEGLPGWVGDLVQVGLGAAGILCFNAGFFLMRPG